MKQVQRRRPRSTGEQPPANNMTANGQDFEPGDRFRLTRCPGQIFKFLGLREDQGGAYVSAWGGDRNVKGRNSYRTFRTTEAFIKVVETETEKRNRLRELENLRLIEPEASE